MVTMGLATACIGFLPTYAQVGSARARAARALRLVQGLALGGEYGGAATYVAEHVPDERRGYYTSFIQTTATLGFFLSLGVIGACRAGLRAGDVQGLRLARAVSRVLRAARGVALHPPEDARVAALREAEDGGPASRRTR